MSKAVLRTRPLGRTPWPTQDPFLFCVHHQDNYPPADGDSLAPPKATLRGRNLGSDFSYKDGWSMYHGQRIPGFPAHPHRGFETLTIARTGVVDHFDSLGSTGRFGGGDLQWMTAGNGIRHCEMFPLLNADKRNPLDLFQIWLNLPRLSKKVPAHFKMLWNEDIPRYSYPGNVVVTPYSGSTALPTPSSPPSIAHPPTPPPDSWANDPSHNVWVWTIKLPPGSTFNVPTTTARVTRSLFFYVGSGLTVSGFGAVDSRTVLEVDASVPVELGNAAASPGDVEVLLLQGQPISEPVAQHGPFVMNSHEEIEQTFEDYHRTGQFGGWEWGSDAPTHGREQGRFARYKDGHTEVPRTIAAKDEV